MRKRSARVDSRFLFVEISDPEIHALLSGLRNEFTGEGTHCAPVHITVRGPYTQPLGLTRVKRYEGYLRGSPLLLHAPGTFEFPNSSIVYLRADSEAMRRIWYKPDFPTKIFGFNPHVTLYSGPDKKLAEKLVAFLKAEDIRLLCHRFRLVEYVRKQNDMFNDEERPNAVHFLGLTNRRLVRADILQRAHNVVRKHQRELQEQHLNGPAPNRRREQPG